MVCNVPSAPGTIILVIPAPTAIPFNKSTEVIWYNKDLFEELNLEVPTTYEEFANVAKTITEEKGILSINEISKLVGNVLKKYNEVEFCYLFGSYAKGYAKENSDIDLCISTSLVGLSFVGLIEELRVSLNKKVDVLRLKDLNNNIDLINEIMKEGIKIHG